MRLSLAPTDISAQTIFYGKPQLNNIMRDSEFSRITYSSNNLSTSGILLSVHLKIDKQSTYYNKYKLYFNQEENGEIIDQLKKVEIQILNARPNKHLSPSYKLARQLNQGYIRIYSEGEYEPADRSHMHLKIAGVWATESESGITYKFSSCQPENPTSS